jgi:hypothetical protein
MGKMAFTRELIIIIIFCDIKKFGNSFQKFPNLIKFLMRKKKISQIFGRKVTKFPPPQKITVA